ncbi:PREDICTED: uncharacterized protein LOC109327687 [Lupinus angustifolius]|uniref:uncharacterized protein LOC109327687 n=1 Tax=Lupinus angustifolius TaxID=3871 RepID=UPI00092EBEDD|nr:PREDICTED: uncharacterized protein LOC109327687 [Lupinus angustifolius]
MLVYVDDLILTGNDLQQISNTKIILDNKFSIKDIGQLKYFLGMKVARTTEGISLYQRKYTLDLLQEIGLLVAKPASTPMECNAKLHSKSGTPLTNITTYRRLIGRLLYLTHTRPVISLSVEFLSQFLSNPTDLHHKAATRVLRYLKNSPGQGILFPRNNSIVLKGYSDSDWAGCLDTRKSITG